MLIVKAVLVGLSVPLLALAAALALGRRDFALGAASGGAIGVVSFLLLMAMVGWMSRRKAGLALATWGAKLGMMGAILYAVLALGGAHPGGVLLGITALPASATAFFYLGRRRG